MYTVTLTADNRAAFDALMRFAAEQHLTVETQPNNGTPESAAAAAREVPDESEPVRQSATDDPRYDAKKVSFEQWNSRFIETDYTRAMDQDELMAFRRRIYEAERSEFMSFETFMKSLNSWKGRTLGD